MADRDARLARVTATPAGIVEAGKQFRRVNGHMHLTALRASLQRVTTETPMPDRQNETVNAA